MLCLKKRGSTSRDRLVGSAMTIDAPSADQRITSSVSAVETRLNEEQDPVY